LPDGFFERFLMDYKTLRFDKRVEWKSMDQNFRNFLFKYFRKFLNKIISFRKIRT
jgi:hypothetical protein